MIAKGRVESRVSAMGACDGFVGWMGFDRCCYLDGEFSGLKSALTVCDHVSGHPSLGCKAGGVWVE